MQVECRRDRELAVRGEFLQRNESRADILTLRSVAQFTTSQVSDQQPSIGEEHGQVCSCVAFGSTGVCVGHHLLLHELTGADKNKADPNGPPLWGAALR